MGSLRFLNCESNEGGARKRGKRSFCRFRRRTEEAAHADSRNIAGKSADDRDMSFKNMRLKNVSSGETEVPEERRQVL